MNFSYSGKRVRSIDYFRGITILIMIWVNEMAGVSDIALWLKHMAADADAMSFVDIVFPAFLFIVGMSIPFAILVRIERGDKSFDLGLHIFMRFLGLIVLGLFMMNAETGYDASRMGIPISLWALLSFLFAILIWNSYKVTVDHKIKLGLKGIGWVGLFILYLLYDSTNGGSMQIHWWGILGLIGWAYLISVGIYLAGRAQLKFIGAALVLITIIYVILKVVPLPDLFFINFIGNQLGHLIHASIVLSGCVVSLILFNENREFKIQQRFRHLLIFIVLVVLAGMVLRPHFTISKIWATPSWAFYSVAVCAGLYSLIFYLMEIKSLSIGYKWLEPAASNPLLIYIIPYIILHIASLSGISITPTFATFGFAGIFWTLAYALFMVIVVRWLNRVHLRLHL